MITQLKYQNFRNFENYSVEITKKNNVLVAPNGSGKSNFLEGIFLLGTGFSPRTKKTAECIRWGETIGRVEAQANGKNIAVVLRSGGRQFFVNGKSTDFKSFLPELQVVLFQPTDLNLLVGTPSLRRIYLDRLLAQTEYEYLFALANQKRLLKHRNSLLKNNKQEEGVLDTIEDQLSMYAGIIYRKRYEVIKTINEHLSKFGASISYIPSPQSLREIMDQGAGKNKGVEMEQGCAVFMRGKMRELREKEKSIGFSLIGPQRDDFEIFVNDPDNPTGNKNLGVYGSRGQQRMFIIYLKTIESKIIEHLTSRKPITIMDDVFSELDETNQKILLENTFGDLVFVTSTKKELIPAEFPSYSRINVEGISAGIKTWR